ncbi:MAG TPA: VOC family protein [Candidatus Sulfotelmatobacter sp.]|nr:VOC family protein [Candidatus Sulfotelmatobacter sp.]
MNGPAKVGTTIAPWLSVRNSVRAVDFYKAAFGATEAFRMDEGGSTVARLSVQGAEFWVGDESPEHSNFSPETLKGSSVRIILTVADPDAMFARAISAGATQVFPVGEEYGWRLGRVVDPFGHHWEIGRPLS